MASRPPLHVPSPRGAAVAALGFPPSTVPSARPQSASPSGSAATNLQPKRPLSASPVQTPSAANAAFRSRAIAGVVPTALVASPRTRPASASRVHTTYAPSILTRRVDNESEHDDADTIAIPVARTQLNAEHVPVTNGSVVASRAEDAGQSSAGPTPLDRATIAQAEQFVIAWQHEEASFRSPLLYAEASLAQAKAMTAHAWPHPNVFLSSIAFGSLELFCASLERQAPFLAELVDTIGTALFTNHRELQSSPLHHRRSHHAARFLDYMRHGRFCFQQLHAHEEQLRVWRSAAQKAQRETQQLREQLQKQHVARLFDRVQARARSATASASADDSGSGTSPNKGDSTHSQQSYPQLRRILYGDQRGAHLDLQPNDYEFAPTAEEILLVFNSMRPLEAHKLLQMLQTKASDTSVPELGELYATAVDALDEAERRVFLREYFQLLSSEELQDALRERDESNHDKKWQTFLDEMKTVLRIHDTSKDASSGSHAVGALPNFKSDEARISASVYELVDLVEDLAAEVSLSDITQPLKLSPETVSCLKPFQNAKKKTEKAKQLMAAPPECATQHALIESMVCRCVCGSLRLVTVDDNALASASELKLNRVIPIDALEDELDVNGDESAKDRSRGKKNASRRPSSAKRANKRKSVAYSTSARVSTRNSMASVRLFPLSDVCQLVSSVVQLHFARESADGPSARRASTRRESQLRSSGSTGSGGAPQRPSFRALAKDLLTRKYGIKSIAVIHMLQLEKSLVHYGATNHHTRCELFAWFVGADKTRAHYKQLGFQFYLRAVKAVVATLAKKALGAVSYADLITTWTEQIGDADTTTGASLAKSLTSAQCVDVCTAIFPTWAQESSAFLSLIERLRVSTESFEIDHLLKRVLAAWEMQFLTAYAQIEEILLTETGAEVDKLDFAVFRRFVAVCELDMAKGQLIEHFNNLVGHEEDKVSLEKAIVFVIEHKYQ